MEVLAEAQCLPGGSCSELQVQHLGRNKQETISKTYNVLKENKCYKDYENQEGTTCGYNF